MRKLLTILLIILIPFSIWAEQIKVASFNMFRFGDNIKKDYVSLSAAISQFDLVGCIEIINPKGMDKLIAILGPDWKYFVSEKSVGTVTYKEYYGYIWNSKKVSMVKSLGFYPDQHNEFIREPYGAIFQSGELDFTLVPCHIIFGINDKQRAAEIAFLKDVYSYFLLAASGDKDIIIAGDFNESRELTFRALEAIDGFKDALAFKYKTTLGEKALANAYDHVFINKYTAEKFVEAGVYNFVKDGNYLVARKTISDHLPAYIILNNDLDTDKYSN